MFVHVLGYFFLWLHPLSQHGGVVQLGGLLRLQPLGDAPPAAVQLLPQRLQLRAAELRRRRDTTVRRNRGSAVPRGAPPTLQSSSAVSLWTARCQSCSWTLSWSRSCCTAALSCSVADWDCRRLTLPSGEVGGALWWRQKKQEGGEGQAGEQRILQKDQSSHLNNRFLKSIVGVF